MAIFVFKAIYINFYQLFITLFLACLMIWSFTLILAQYFTKQWNPNDSEDPLCARVSGCYFYTLNLGLRNGGGIGDVMNLKLWDTDQFGARFFFDLSFFFLINTVSLNIIFGVVIDSFAGLRDNLNQRK